jgi:hypothetical protein
MLSFIPRGLRWWRKVRVCERANRHAYHRRKTVGFPPYRRSTDTAEVESDIEAVVGPSSELGRRSLRDRDLVPGEERGDAEDRARSTLAIEAVAKRNTDRLATTVDHQPATLTCCFPVHVAELNTIRKVLQSGMR